MLLGVLVVGGLKHLEVKAHASKTRILYNAYEVRIYSIIAAIIRTLPSLIISLSREASERGEPTAAGLLKFVKTQIFIATAHHLHKVFPRISRLSLLFKTEDVDFTMAKPCLDATVTAVTTHKTDELKEVDDTIRSER